VKPRASGALINRMRHGSGEQARVARAVHSVADKRLLRFMARVAVVVRGVCFSHYFSGRRRMLYAARVRALLKPCYRRVGDAQQAKRREMFNR